MKKRIAVMVLALGMVLCACGDNSGSGAGETDGTAAEMEALDESNGSGAGAEGFGEGNPAGGAEAASSHMKASGNGGEAEGSTGKTAENGGETEGSAGKTAGNGGEAEGSAGKTAENGGETEGSAGKTAENGGEIAETGGRTAESGGEVPGQGSEGGKAEGTEGTRVAQGGPYGEISVMLPDGWKYEIFPMDSEGLISGDYGIHFYPEGVTEGFIELAYIDFFGVCGTGLAQEDAEIAGSPVSIGTYDGHPYWDFVRFTEQNDGIVALTYWVEDWWEGYGDAVATILDTMTFDRNEKEGGAYVFKKESENQEIGLYFSLKDISSTGAVLVYNQFDAEAPTGELQDGDGFVIERCRDGNWEEVPVVAEGDYGFHDVAYNIPKEEVTERELNWEWLYGQLASGEYRVGKSILDFRKTADYDKYTVYAYFILHVNDI